MDQSFYGRCHPDNIWAMTGLASCLTARLKGGDAGVEEELNQLLSKIAQIKERADVDVSVACMCAKGVE
jgi:hypothetical protein